MQPQQAIFVVFFSMPFVMGLLAHLFVPPAPGALPVALPQGTLDWVAMTLALVLTLASVALGLAVDADASKPERRNAPVDPRWVIRLALAEAVALLGCLVTFLSQRAGAWAPFSIFALVAMIAARPRQA